MSERLTLPSTPGIVLLHDTEHQDRYLPVQSAGLEPPYSVRSFTDYLQGPAPENSGLHAAVSGADILMIQQCLIEPLTADAHLAVSSLGLVSRRGYKTRFYLYDDEYHSEYLHPSQKRSLAERLWTPRVSS